jgi:nicotinamide-nucleotide amidase
MMATSEEILGKRLAEAGLTIAVAESCTGGSLAARITSVPGSSAYFKGGVVAYANEVKQSLLGVSAATLERQGAVSRETVIEMAHGVRRVMQTDCAIATSGIAGPSGGTPLKPVGTVWIAAIYKDRTETMMLERDLGREMNVARACNNALLLLLELLK